MYSPVTHYVSPSQGQPDPVQQLDSLIESHDVVYALTDSREARWLATVISVAKDKPLISVALGFDSYLVVNSKIYAKKRI